jgi:hypothetical protein
VTPVTTHRRALRRGDGRRRQGTGRPGGPPTLFDAAPTTVPVAAPVEVPASVDVPAPAPVEVAAPVPVAPPPGREADGESGPEVGIAGSGETLDRLVVGGWERLAARAEIPCLLCGGPMVPSYGAHAAPIGGRCRDCGTTLS